MRKIIGSIGSICLLVVLAVFARPAVRAIVGTLDISGTSQTVTGDITAARIVDSANSAYFIDPAATGDSLVAVGKVTAGSFAGDGSLLTGISGIPAGLVSFFNLASCPTGWTELTAARGMYIVGLPLSGTLAGTSGTALTNLETRAVGQHTHTITDPGHTHNRKFDGGGACDYCTEAYDRSAAGVPTSGHIYSNTTGITINNAGSVAGTNAPYIQLLACQKN